MNKEYYVKLKTLREKKGYSQASVSERLHVTRQTVSQWETGKYLPDVEKLASLCELYEISLDELLEINSRPVTIDSTPAKEVHICEPETEDTSHHFQLGNLSQEQARALEIIGLAVILILTCQFAIFGPFVDIIVAVWLKKTKRNYKIIYLLCLICFLISSYNIYTIIDYMFINRYDVIIEKI